jgi:Beta-propeller repeat
MLASIGLFGLLSSSQAVPIAPERSAAHGYQLPLTFEVNQGQTDDRVDFLAHGPNYNIFLTATEAVFALPEASAKSGHRPVMRMQLVGSAADPAVQGVDALPGKINYFRGRDAASWKTKVPTYQRVKYSAVYPGVDLVYYGQSQQLEYDFIVAPGADPNTIKLGFAGVEQTTVDAQGDLVLKTAGGPLRFQKPVIYQINDGRRHPVEGGYVHRRRHQIGFRVGAYDRSRPLIIDPVLSYSTYLGGSGTEGSTGIAVDATGAVYVAGSTSSTDFPTVNAMQPERNGFVSDLFVAKLTPDGTALVYATYLGGSNDEGGADIAVDSAGAAYISAITFSEDFPTVNAFQPAPKGTDVVVAKLSADGSRLIYSTYLGGNGYEAEAAITVDLAGAAYIAGTTASVDFPVVNALQPTLPENRLAAFVTKFAPDGSALLYSTYLGGTQQGAGARDIAVDSLGAAYVTGWKTSADFPLVNPLPGTGGGVDAFVSKLAPDGMSLIYSTFLGGSGSDWGLGIAIDAGGAAYVTGNTDSGDFPTMNAVQPQSDGGVDAFVVKIAPEGGAMIYGTYLGGLGHDSGYGIAVDTAGAAHVTGRTESADFPTMNALQPALSGRVDAFVSLLSPNGEALVYSTYLGGSKEEGARFRFLGFPTSMAITVDFTGATYVTSWTRSKDFPTTTSLFARCRGGDSDAFVVKITDDSLASPAAGASVAGPPTSESSSTSTSSERKSGGGAMDALFLAVLAQLAVAGALRRRTLRGQ